MLFILKECCEWIQQYRVQVKLQRGKDETRGRFLPSVKIAKSSCFQECAPVDPNVVYSFSVDEVRCTKRFGSSNDMSRPDSW